MQTETVQAPPKTRKPYYSLINGSWYKVFENGEKKKMQIAYDEYGEIYFVEA